MFPLDLRRRRFPLDAGDEIQGSCHYFKRPPMSQCTPDTPESPEMTRWSSRGPTQNTMAGVTALWRLKRKPHIPMVNTTGSLTLLFQLERRADLHGSTRDEALLPCGCPRGNPRSMSALERKPVGTLAPAATVGESRGALATPVETGTPWSPTSVSLRSPL